MVTVSSKELNEHINEYFVFRSETDSSKQVGKLLAVFDNKIRLEVITGKNKGKKYECQYLSNHVDMYTDENVILAFAGL